MDNCSQLARATSTLAKIHMGAAKHLLRYLAGTKDFAITYNRRKLYLHAFSDATWGNDPSNGKSTSCLIVAVCRVSVASRPANKASRECRRWKPSCGWGARYEGFCSNMMKELGFGTQFEQVPVKKSTTRRLSTPSATRRSALKPNKSLFASSTYESL